MKGKRRKLLISLTLLLFILIISSCASADKKTALRVIIVPKFEIDEMSGDFPGEAQLFYEKYCEGCEETEIPHMPPSGHFYVNEENGVGILITGSGKTAACDYDLGHHVDAHEKKKSSNHIMWFPDDAYADYECKFFDVELCEKVFHMIKDCPLRTTEEAKTVIKENFPPREDAEILPAVKKGTALSGDNFWKGVYGHVAAPDR